MAHCTLIAQHTNTYNKTDGSLRSENSSYHDMIWRILKLNNMLLPVNFLK